MKSKDKVFTEFLRRHFESLLWIFIVLKLTELIDWSWFWVLFPMILPLSISGIAFAGLGVIYVYDRIRKKRIVKSLRDSLLSCIKKRASDEQQQGDK